MQRLLNSGNDVRSGFDRVIDDGATPANRLYARFVFDTVSAAGRAAQGRLPSALFEIDFAQFAVVRQGTLQYENRTRAGPTVRRYSPKFALTAVKLLSASRLMEDPIRLPPSARDDHSNP